MAFVHSAGPFDFESPHHALAEELCRWMFTAYGMEAAEKLYYDLPEADRRRIVALSKTRFRPNVDDEDAYIEARRRLRRAVILKETQPH